MAENDAEEVVVELCRVEIGTSVSKFVEEHEDEFEVDDNSGKVRSKVTGMEFGSTKKGSDNDGKLLAALQQYVKGKKYVFAKENMRARAAAAEHEFLVPHRHHKKWLYCLFCQKQVNLIVEDVNNHVNSRKCKFNRTLKSLKRVEGENGEELVVEEASEGSEASSEEDVESLFFDYNGDGDSEEDEEEMSGEEAKSTDGAGAAVGKGKKGIKEKRAASAGSDKKKRKASAASTASKKRRMK